LRAVDARKELELASTKRTAAGTKKNGGTGAAAKATGGAKTERPKLRSSHGARSYAAKKAHGGTRPETQRRGVKSATTKASATKTEATKTAKTGAAKAGPRTALTAGPRMKKARPAAAPAPSSSLASDQAREVAVAIAVAALDKKAVGLEILDVAGKVDYADFLVLMTGRSDRQVAALAQGIEEALRKKSIRPLSVEGLPSASWVLMDFGDVVVHVFQDDARSLYDIEGLWLDARRIPVPLPENLRS
jgi:ribosome-associated protein